MSWVFPSLRALRQEPGVHSAWSLFYDGNQQQNVTGGPESLADGLTPGPPRLKAGGYPAHAPTASDRGGPGVPELVPLTDAEGGRGLRLVSGLTAWQGPEPVCVSHRRGSGQSHR